MCEQKGIMYTQKEMMCLKIYLQISTRLYSSYDMEAIAFSSAAIIILLDNKMTSKYTYVYHI